MRAVLQRVTSARVVVGDETVGEIAAGFLALVGVGHNDDVASAHRLADKISGLRVFADDDGRMNLSLGDVSGGVLVVSQFTLFADTSKGRRPSFVDAAEPGVASQLVDEVVAELARRGHPVATGRFGAHMVVELVNDGPVTVVLDEGSGV